MEQKSFSLLCPFVSLIFCATPANLLPLFCGPQKQSRKAAQQHLDALNVSPLSSIKGEEPNECFFILDPTKALFWLLFLVAAFQPSRLLRIRIVGGRFVAQEDRFLFLFFRFVDTNLAENRWWSFATTPALGNVGGSFAYCQLLWNCSCCQCRWLSRTSNGGYVVMNRWRRVIQSLAGRYFPRWFLFSFLFFFFLSHAGKSFSLSIVFTSSFFSCVFSFSSVFVFLPFFCSSFLREEMRGNSLQKIGEKMNEKETKSNRNYSVSLALTHPVSPSSSPYRLFCGHLVGALFEN